MAVFKDQVCDFCGRKRKWTATSTFHNVYCEECLRISRKEDALCLREIQQARKAEQTLEGA